MSELGLVPVSQAPFLLPTIQSIYSVEQTEYSFKVAMKDNQLRVLPISESPVLSPASQAYDIKVLVDMKDDSLPPSFKLLWSAK
ncbi:hypothetical protein CHS0354_021802, partial [Potamilus streckersoni]